MLNRVKKILSNKIVLLILSLIAILIFTLSLVPPKYVEDQTVQKTESKIAKRLDKIANSIVNIQLTNKNIRPLNSLLESMGIEIPKNIEKEDSIVEDEGEPSDEDNIIKDEVDQELDKIDSENQKLSNKRSYIVKSGDSLSKILSTSKVNINDINLLYSNYKKLENLNIGQKISWEVDDDNNLLKYSRILNDDTIETYIKNNDKFEEKTEKFNKNWEEIVLSGTLDSKSFVSKANSIGLTTDEIKMITSSLQWKLDFKDLAKDDQFNIVLSREMFGPYHNDSKILGVKITSKNKDYIALLAEDGNYYDENGKALSRNFLKLPLNDESVLISSKFNPNRLHPITKKYMPHNGVDLAVKTGTQVLAAGDGEVVFAGRSGSAGNMISIRHGRQYVTRYMHLSKIDVQTGQKVKMGDLIGLSGNTGNSTGAHLHYEVLVDNVAKDPLKMNFTETKSLEGINKLAFIKNTKDIIKKLDYSSNEENKLLANNANIIAEMLNK